MEGIMADRHPMRAHHVHTQGRGAGATARRDEDHHAARIAYESSDDNPFEPGTRRWHHFERYKANGVTGFDAPRGPRR